MPRPTHALPSLAAALGVLAAASAISAIQGAPEADAAQPDAPPLSAPAQRDVPLVEDRARPAVPPREAPALVPSETAPLPGGSAGTKAGVPTDLPTTRLRYTASAHLEPEDRRVLGQASIEWQSPAADAITAVPLHLYLNAFSHEETTWMRGVPGRRRVDLEELAEQYGDPWGWIELQTVEQRTAERGSAPCSLRPIQPDDGNILDRTLMEVTLAEPVPPGGTLHLDVEFVARLPIPIARTGGRDGWFHVAQWFPKLGVYEPAGMYGRAQGGFAARQFHGPTEFYADFADYEVVVDVPADYAVVGTGEASPLDGAEPGRARTRFTQRAVHDFVFVAARDLHVETHPFRPGGGGDEIAISYVTPEYGAGSIPDMRAAAEATFDLMGRRVGPYPFSTMKIVEMPWSVRRTAGMEYPTLVTGLISDPFLDRLVLHDLRVREGVIAHEIIHNYFQGIVANDEQEQAFLDEGFTSYWTEQVMDVLRTDAAWARLFRYPFDEGSLKRLSFAEQLDDAREAMVRRPAYLFYPGTHGSQIYTRSTLTFATAANLFGQEAVDRLFSTYFRRHRFTHPTSDDFLSVATEVGPPEMTTFLRESFLAPGMPDYRVEEARTERWEPPLGWVPLPGGRTLVEPGDPDAHGDDAGLDPAAKEIDGMLTMEIVDPGYVDGDEERPGTVERRRVKPGRTPSSLASTDDEEGEDEDEAKDDELVFYTSTVRVRGSRHRHLPVDVVFHFQDDVEVRDRWDGRAAWRGYNFLRAAPLTEVQIDPEDVLQIDPDRLNDGRRIEPDEALAGELGAWLGKTVHWLALGAGWWL